MIYRITITILTVLLSTNLLLAQEADTLATQRPEAATESGSVGARAAFLEEKVKALESALEESRLREQSTARLLADTEDRLQEVLEQQAATDPQERTEALPTPPAEPAAKERRTERSTRKGEIHTMTGRNRHHSGGFGAVTFKATEYMSDPLIMMGLRGGWIINRSFAIGIEGHGIIPTTNIPDILPSEQVVLLGGYGGLFVEPVFLSNQVLHVTFPVSAGAGWLGYEESFESVNRLPFDQLVDEDVFWYVEPGASIEVNVSRSFRLNFGMSRRFIQDIDLVGTPEDAFSRNNYFFGMKFGSF